MSKLGNWKERDADAAARRAEIPVDTRPVGARLLGDPLPGRSYLDRMLAGKLQPASEEEVPFQ